MSEFWLLAPGELGNSGPPGWWALVHIDRGVFAYAMNEVLAEALLGTARELITF